MCFNQFTLIVFLVTTATQAILSFGLPSSSPSNCPVHRGCESEGPICSSEGKTYKTKCDLLIDQCKRPGITVIANYACSTCLLERHANLAVKAESDLQSGVEILIPECDLPKGFYKSQQCHKETGYCWCVDVDNGKPIWRTSAKSDKAATDCDALARKVNRRRRPRRDKKKCNRTEKTDLIRELVNHFSVEHEEHFHFKLEDTQSLLGYKFGLLDEDKDGNLTRTEFKDFRSSLSPRIKQNPCSVSFFKGIDHNGDKKISLSEWITFFNNRHHQQSQFEIPVKPEPNRVHFSRFLL